MFKKQTFGLLIISLIFAGTLFVSKESYKFVNTHDEDDYSVSGYLMSRKDYVFGRDIFSHHLPGAYLLSEGLDMVFQPQNTDESVFWHRTVTAGVNYIMAIVLFKILGGGSLWLILVIELMRVGFLRGLYHAENLVVYPMVYILITIFEKKFYRPIVWGISNGLITTFLAPLWPLTALSVVDITVWMRKEKRKLILPLLIIILMSLAVLIPIDIKSFMTDFFGYNTLTYAPMLIKKPILYMGSIFLAPLLVFGDFSFSPTSLMSQFLVMGWLMASIRRKNLWTFGLMWFVLAVIGFRRAPRWDNSSLDFHALPWLVTLATFYWIQKGQKVSKKIWTGTLTAMVLFWSFFFPNGQQAGKMVIRYPDNSVIVRYLRKENKPKSTLFTLPAHTLLYRQTNMKPFNKFLFFLPWMEKSPILFDQLNESFGKGLPTYLYIDDKNFPYTPPEIIKEILPRYREVSLMEEIVIYKLIESGE